LKQEELNPKLQKELILKMEESILNKFKDCKLVSAVLEFKIDKDDTKEKLDSIRKDIESRLDYSIKSWCFIEYKEPKIHVLEITSK